MHIFHTTSGFKRPNVSRNTRRNCNFSLPFKNLPLKLHVDPTSILKTIAKHSLLRLEYFIFQPFYFEHLKSTVYGSWSCSGLKTCTLVWQRNYHVNSFIYKKTIELYFDLFYCKWRELIVEIQLIWFWLINILGLLSDYRKEEIIRSMNLINCFGARGYSIRGIYLPIVLLLF